MDSTTTFLAKKIIYLPNHIIRKTVVNVGLPICFFISVCLFTLCSLIMLLFCQRSSNNADEKDLRKILDEFAESGLGDEKTRSRTNLYISDETSILLGNDAGLRSDFLGSFILNKEISREHVSFSKF